LFPENAVEYFVSYYDYYLPESYIPATDTYIAKDASINDELDKMRLSATRSLLDRRDVIVVASCRASTASARRRTSTIWFVSSRRAHDRRADILRRLIEIQYHRNDTDFYRGTFRVRGDVVDVFPAYEERKAVRLEFFGDELETISEIDSLTGKKLRPLRRMAIYPSTFYVTGGDKRGRAIELIRAELRERLIDLRAQNKLVEAQRLEQRTMYDLEMMEEMGTCVGIENYSRHLAARGAGEPPTVCSTISRSRFYSSLTRATRASRSFAPCIGPTARARRRSLRMDSGCRRPSTIARSNSRSFSNTSIKPSLFRPRPPNGNSSARAASVAEQVIRPTGLIDPAIEVRPATGQVTICSARCACALRAASVCWSRL